MTNFIYLQFRESCTVSANSCEKLVVIKKMRERKEKVVLLEEESVIGELGKVRTRGR